MCQAMNIRGKHIDGVRSTISVLAVGKTMQRKEKPNVLFAKWKEESTKEPIKEVQSQYKGTKSI